MNNATTHDSGGLLVDNDRSRHQLPIELCFHGEYLIRGGFSSSESSSQIADDISRVAYFKYLDDGSHHGRDLHYWLEAEMDVLSQRDRSQAEFYQEPG